MFEFSPYHMALAVLGCGLIVAYWLPRFVSGREPAASTLLILSGMGCQHAAAGTAGIPARTSACPQLYSGSTRPLRVTR